MIRARTTPLHIVLATLLLCLLGTTSLQAREASPELLVGDPDNPIKLDVPYVPTPQETVHRMLEMAQPQPDEYLIDLGSGDGRFVIQAVTNWDVRKAVGVEIDPERVAEARENARAAGIEDRVEFEEGDLFDMDFTDADVLTMYLLESINLKLRPIILEEMRPGARVVSHVFDMGEWQPDEQVQMQSLNAYMWIVPAHVGGDWRIDLPDGEGFSISLTQRFQEVDGTAVVEGNSIPMPYAHLRGDTLRFTANGQHFIGKVEGDEITGIAGPGAVESWHAKRL